jgi:uncharacterized protein (TIGR00369 family)
MASAVSGLEMLHQVIDGTVEAPVCSLVGFRLVSAGEGTTTFEFEPRQAHYNVLGTVHGGIVATILDSSMGCAVHSRLAPGASYATVEININYVRPVTESTGLMRCEGQVTTLGMRMALARAEITDLRGKVYAHGTTVCLIQR